MGGGVFVGIHVTHDAAIVVRVDLKGFEPAEEISQVECATDGEPYRADHRDNGGEADRVVLPVEEPCGIAPHAEDEVPPGGDEENGEVEHRPPEYRPCKPAVAAAVFAVEAQQLLQDAGFLSGSCGGGRGTWLLDFVLAAMEHAVEVEFFAAGEQRDQDVRGAGRHHRDQEDFLAGDGEFRRADFPVGDAQGTAEACERVSHAIEEGGMIRGEPGVDHVCPILGAEETEESEEEPHKHGGPCSGTCSARPIHAADNHRAGAPEVERTGEGEEHQDVSRLPIEQTEEEGKDRHAGDRQAQQQELGFLRKRFFAQGKDHILHEDAAP